MEELQCNKVEELFNNLYEGKIKMNPNEIIKIKEVFGIEEVSSDVDKEDSYSIRCGNYRYTLTVSQKENFDNFMELLKVREDNGLYNQINIDYTDIKEITLEVVK